MIANRTKAVDLPRAIPSMAMSSSARGFPTVANGSDDSSLDGIISGAVVVIVVVVTVEPGARR